MQTKNSVNPELLSIPSDLLKETLLICLQNAVPFEIIQYQSYSDSFQFKVWGDPKYRMHKMAMENIFSHLEDHRHYRYGKPNEPTG